MTYGEVLFRLSKLLPNVDPDLIEGWVSDRYVAILDRLDWQRLDIETTLITVVPYLTGTVAVTNGSASITGAGTAWTSAMTGRVVRIADEDTYYTFTYLSGTTGTLDRAYEGTTNSTAAAWITQPYYALPSDARYVTGIASFLWGPLERRSLEWIKERDPMLRVTGSPRYWAAGMDASGNVLRIILWPVPDQATSLTLSYASEQIVPGSTSTTMIPWLRPSALIAGVQADAAMQPPGRDVTASQMYEGKFEARIAEMVMNEARNSPPVRVKVADRYTRHQRKRWAYDIQ